MCRGQATSAHMNPAPTTTRAPRRHASRIAAASAARSAFTPARGSLVSEVGLEPGEDPVPRRCVVNMDSVESVSVAVLVERLGRLADTRMRQICGALADAVDCAD